MSYSYNLNFHEEIMTSDTRFRVLIAGVCLAGAASLVTAQASSIYLVPPNQTANPGNPVQLELWMDFTGDPTIGGGIDVNFDNFVDGNQLSFISYTPAALGDPLLISAPALSALGDALQGITFGDLVNGLEGPALVGTLAFTANLVGNYGFSLADNADAGGFYSISGPQQFPLYTGSAVVIEAAPPPPGGVPLPGTAWLVLIGLPALAKRQRTI